MRLTTATFRPSVGKSRRSGSCTIPTSAPYGAYISLPKCGLVMEHMDVGSLWSKLHNEGSMVSIDFMSVAIQASQPPPQNTHPHTLSNNTNNPLSSPQTRLSMRCYLPGPSFLAPLLLPLAVSGRRLRFIAQSSLFYLPASCLLPSPIFSRRI